MNLSIQKRTQLVRDSWLRHDAMWFENAMSLCEFKTLNKLNKKIVFRLAQFEMYSLVRSVDSFSYPNDMRNLSTILKVAVDIYQTSRSKVEIELLDENTLTIKMYECWACKSIENAGLLDEYECGPWQRLKGWLLALEVDYNMNPDPVACLKHLGVHDGSVCEVEVKVLSFNNNQIS